MNSLYRHNLAALMTAVGLAFLPSKVLAQTFVSGSTGADGAFNPTCTPSALHGDRAIAA